jgi:hypothetical protein
MGDLYTERRKKTKSEPKGAMDIVLADEERELGASSNKRDMSLYFSM